MISYSLNKYHTTAVAQFRLKVINFHSQFGTQATLAAFLVKRAIVFLWKKRFRDSGGRLASLVPCSTKPHHLRTPMVDPKIVEEIKRLREDKYSPGKKKLKPMIDKFCFQHGLKPISESTIGKVLKRNNYFKDKQNQTRHGYHTATGKWERKRKWKIKRQRVRYHHLIHDPYQFNQKMIEYLWGKTP